MIESDNKSLEGVYYDHLKVEYEKLGAVKLNGFVSMKWKGIIYSRQHKNVTALIPLKIILIRSGCTSRN
jgi:hypothetical protein